MKQTLEWFKTRISQTIFRNHYECYCDTCERVVDEGLVIRDEEHAQYLFDIQNDFGAEGIELNYRDEK
jgi:hypothetical protein